jgi:Cu+-exporting ATPase
VVRNGREEDISLDEVAVGDIVLIRPGGRIPVDGEVVSGESYVNESMITGEPIPSLRRTGNTVVGGTLNTNSILSVKTTKVGKDTVLARIIQLVEDAQGSRPPVQKIADLAVTWFIPVVILLAAFSFTVWFVFLHSTLLFALTALIAVLVVACPCALGLATPTAVTVGVGRGAELGILIRNGEALEVSEKITTIIFDKTGTLTTGRPEVTDLVSIGVTDEALLAYTVSVEKGSQHPLAEAIVRKGKMNGTPVKPVERFDTYEGKGVFARVEGVDVLTGNRALMLEKGIDILPDIDARLSGFERSGKTAVLVAAGGKLIGLIAIADTVKKTTKHAVALFREMNIQVVMITGDNRRTANAIAQQTGIETVIAEVLPQDKAAEVRKLQEHGEIVGFVGDGINDAPALAQADVGIAIGSGTDVAIESGDIVLIKDDLVDAVSAVQLSKKVMGRIKGNIFWAFAYNIVLIPIAAGVLYPSFGIIFRPELAGLAMAASSVTVISLSLLLKKYTPEAKTGVE